MEKIVYTYVDKDALQGEWITELLNKLYSVAYPRTKSTWKGLCELYKEHSHGKYKYPTDFYYIPQEVQKTIIDDFLEKHNIAFHWKEDMEFLIKLLFDKGGLKEVYGPTDWSEEPLRHCVDVPVLEEIIPREFADTVKEVIKGYANTYKFGRRDYNNVAFTVYNYSPSSVRDYVVQAWKGLGVDITIPEDSAWVDEFENMEEEA